MVCKIMAGDVVAMSVYLLLQDVWIQVLVAICSSNIEKFVYELLLDCEACMILPVVLLHLVCLYC